MTPLLNAYPNSRFRALAPRFLLLKCTYLLKYTIKLRALIFQIFISSVFHVERFKSCVRGGAGFGWMGFVFFYPSFFFFVLIFPRDGKSICDDLMAFILSDVFGEEKNNFAYVMLTCLNFSVPLHFYHISIALFCCCSQGIRYL